MTAYGHDSGVSKEEDPHDLILLQVPPVLKEMSL
jgi:hypothetical protein